MSDLRFAAKSVVDKATDSAALSVGTAVAFVPLHSGNHQCYITERMGLNHR